MLGIFATLARSCDDRKWWREDPELAASHCIPDRMRAMREATSTKNVLGKVGSAYRPKYLEYPSRLRSKWTYFNSNGDLWGRFKYKPWVKWNYSPILSGFAWASSKYQAASAKHQESIKYYDTFQQRVRNICIYWIRADIFYECLVSHSKTICRNL